MVQPIAASAHNYSGVISTGNRVEGDRAFPGAVEWRGHFQGQKESVATIFSGA